MLESFLNCSANYLCNELKNKGGMKIFSPMNGVCYTFNLNYQASQDVYKMIASGQLHKVTIEFNIESKCNFNEVN